MFGVLKSYLSHQLSSFLRIQKVLIFHLFVPFQCVHTHLFSTYAYTHTGSADACLHLRTCFRRHALASDSPFSLHLPLSCDISQAQCLSHPAFRARSQLRFHSSSFVFVCLFVWLSSCLCVV